jgi:hypothetical protein
MSKFNIQEIKEKKLPNQPIIEGAHLQYVYKHCAKFELEAQH